MATIHVDGTSYEVDGSDNLLRACLSLGLDIPYFCWHPALGSVGACRQCAVKQYANADDTRGRLVMSCMTPATNDSWISIDDEEAVAFRASVVEWLMTNHPHDCPVCEEGGHCHLQDMTVMVQHSQRQYRFSKRTHQNQDLGPFINHEMNRCIACYRCVRFYKDYAGGTDLGVYGAHDNVYFGRTEDGVLESEFSGNLAEVCPTGVFTDKTHSERYNRKWDMQYAPSVCHGCSLGCNISPGERYGELRRIENRYNGSVNHYFLCDKGRFGYGYVNRDDRPQQPSLHGQALGLDAALDQAATLLKGKRVIGIGSPRASLEANFALHELVGEGAFYSGFSAAEHALVHAAVRVLQHSPARIPALREVESCDAVLVLGEDVTQTGARLALALRQAAKQRAVQLAADKKVQIWQDEAIRNIGQHERSPLFIASFEATRLDDIASETLHADADGIARLGFAVAHAIDPAAPQPAHVSDAEQAQARRIADALLAAKKPLVVSGTGAGSVAVIEAAGNIARALKQAGREAGISLVLPEVNSLGTALMGGDSVEAALDAVAQGQADALVVLENDLYRRADAARVDAALAAAQTMLVLDHQRTATADRAGLLFSSASFAEGDGTVVSQEGRAQRFFQVFEPSYYRPDSLIRESWRWLHALHSTLQGRAVDWTQLDEVTAACAEAFPALAGIRDAAPAADYRVKGLKVARSPRRYSGRTSLRANLSVHEPRAPQDADTALAFSMEGFTGPLESGPLTPFAWSPGWNSPQAWNKFQDEVGGHLRGGDAGVRLLEPVAASGAYAPAVLSSDNGEGLRLLPLHHLFGSEEMSARAPVMSSRLAVARAALSLADAEQLGLAEGDTVSLQWPGAVLRLPLRLSAELPAGCVGLPQGLEGMPPLPLQARVQVAKA